MRLRDKVAIITGSAAGIGEAAAEIFVREGAKVLIADRNGEGAERLAEKLGPQAAAFQVDVSSSTEVKRMVEAAIERFGRLDILANNAGYGLLGAVEEATAEEIERIYATNVFGLLKVTRAVLPYMRRQRSGHILNYSSIGGYYGFPGWGVYGSTKFAVEGLSESLATEVEPFGIKVTIIEPGFFRTDFLHDNSLAISPASIPDYVGTPAGNMRDFAASANHAQPGDPAKLTAGIIEMVNAANPPLRMPFGSDTVAKIEEEHASVEKELAQWRQLAVSTDFEQTA
jgi:NAD(P)-dependent dehydrogenase (short-subunit alcohol dehydrogenase family)